VSWDYRISTEALRHLRDLGPSARTEIFGWLDTRIRGTADPAAFGKPLRGKLKGYWRYRVRAWRLLCRLEHDILIVIVVAVGHRSNVYED
jgi:mRNA interferase RelE/StbE